MRITPKFLLKVGLVMFTLVFIVPFLMNHLDSQERERARKQANGNKPSKELLGGHSDSVLRFKTSDPDHHKKKIHANLGKSEHLDDQQGAPPEMQLQPHKVAVAGQKTSTGSGSKKINQDALPTWARNKKYGPKAVLKESIPGNFEPIIKPKDGPGENGQPVYVSMEEKSRADGTVREFGFNMIASDKISMHRTIPDTRMPECKHWQYPEDLPTASVILVFHNEGWSTLMRTVHSVIDASPPNLLKEVIMVDDFSDKPHLKGKLDEYIKQFYGLVKLYRNKERQGLINTRTLGAKYATGDVIVFLDAHCECNRNWLVPLLARIRYDRTIMAVPIVDGIDWSNFRYSPVYSSSGSHFRGIFEWGFLYKESAVPQKVLDKRDYNSEPYWAPTHAGGLFAMDRKFFFELGAYDPGLQIWGGENFELSFKIWQCGGTIEWVPCSRVGHVYRNSMPYGFGKVNPRVPIVLLNYLRVVEVWLDPEHKEYYYTREPTIRGYPPGNITAQLDFKKKNKCRSFKWFLNNVATEVTEKFPFPPPNHVWGEFKQANSYNCWDTLSQSVGGGPIGVSGCHHFGGNQLYRLNVKGQLAHGERCLEASGGFVTIHFCSIDPTGPWEYDAEKKSVFHRSQNKCVQVDGNNKLALRQCNPQEPLQQFIVNEIHPYS